MKRIDMIGYFEPPADKIGFELEPSIARLHQGDLIFPRDLYEEKILTRGDFPNWNKSLQEEVNSVQPRKNTWVANLRTLNYSSGTLSIKYNLTDMKTLFGMRKIGPKLTYVEQENLVRRIAPIAVLGIIETRDNYVAYEVRGKTIQAGGKILQFPAGNIEFANNIGEKMPTPLEELCTEAAEESGFGIEDMQELDLYTVGMVRDRTDSWNPPLVFVMDTPKNLEEVKEKYLAAHQLSLEESERFVPQPLDEGEIRDFVLNNADVFVGNGIGATLLHGRFRFGRKWYDDLVARLEELDFEIVEENPYKY